MELGGTNIIIPLNVPSGDGSDGTPSNVSGVIGLKSVELSGIFEGSYTILGSHDGSNYVPLAVFRGSEEFQQTVAFFPHLAAQAGGPFDEPRGVVARFLKIRRRSSSGSVSISVGAGSSITTNQFVALAPILPGASGIQAAVDLFSLVPTTGFFPGFSIFCVGDIAGLLVLEGSLDGVGFSPLASFLTTTGPASPVVVNQVTRYVRINVRGSILGPTNITLGGATAANVALAGTGSGIDLDDAIKSRVVALTGMQQFSYWSDPFMEIGGRPGSLWLDLHPVDLHQVNTAPGGIMQVTGNVGYGAAYIDPAAAYPFAIPTNASSFFGPVSAAQGIYMFFRFRVLPDPGSGGPGGWNAFCSFIFGFVDATSLRVAGIGVHFGETSFFGAVGGDVTSASSTVGINSTVPFDFNVWHNAEIFTKGGKWWVKIDDTAAIDVSALFGGVGLDHGLPLMQAMGTTLSPAIDVDHAAYAAAANMPPMNTSPTPPI